MTMNSKNFEVFLLTSVLMAVLLLPTQTRAEDWGRWADRHGAGSCLSDIWEECLFAHIEMDAPEIMTKGEVYQWRIKTRFLEKPPIAVKVRLVWLCSDAYTLLGDQAMDFTLGPDDSLEAVMAVEVRRVKYDAPVFCYVFVEKPHRYGRPSITSGDYWFPAGEVAEFWNANPLNPEELVTGSLYKKLKTQAKRNFKEELQAAGQGLRSVPAEAKAIIDSIVPTLDESGRRKLAFVAENLSERTNGSLLDAADFVGRHARIWGMQPQCGSTEKAVDLVIQYLKDGTLATLFYDALKTQTSPSGRIFLYVQEALDGKREWVEVEQKLEVLLKENPGDEDLLRHVPKIRSLIKEQPGGRQGSMD